MSFKDKNNDNMELDDMNIKSHLNTSLDLSGISVSEDLINRTLQAISNQKNLGNQDVNDISSTDVHKKVIPWNRYARRIAGVAAAVFVVVAGYSVLGNISNKAGQEKSSTSDSDTNNSTIMEDAAAPMQEYAATGDEAATESAPAATGEGSSQTNAAQYSITGKTADNGEASYGTDTKIQVAEDRVEVATTEEADASVGTALESEEQQAFNFEAISLLAPEELESLTITSYATGASISLTNQIEILDFYSIMDKYTFTYADGTSLDQYYTVELITPEPGEALYTIWVGEYVVVRYAKGEEASETMYTPMDSEAFKKDLDTFFTNYSS
jgi:hypothetical protein